MIKDLISPSYKVKILFQDEIPDMDKTIYFSEGFTQDTYMIKQNKKGEYVIRMQNTVPIAQAPLPQPNQMVYVFSSTPPAATTAVVTTHSTTTSTHVDPAMGTSVNVNASANGMNVNMSINETQTNTQVSTTSTTTTTSTTVVGTPDDVVYILPGYEGVYGCPYPMSDYDFQQAKRSISDKDFSDSRITLAKQVLDHNCLLCSQVYEMIGLLTYEDDKLEIAKYAYGSTLDIGNYYRINDAFEYESTIEELDEYIRNYRR
jgi:hypothetical protein